MGKLRNYELMFSLEDPHNKTTHGYHKRKGSNYYKKSIRMGGRWSIAIQIKPREFNEKLKEYKLRQQQKNSFPHLSKENKEVLA